VDLDILSIDVFPFRLDLKKNIVDKKRINLPTLIKLKKQISKIYSLQKPTKISTYLKKTFSIFRLADESVFVNDF